MEKGEIMLICNECGEIFEDGDAEIVRDDRGFCGSESVCESLAVCPSCGCDDLADAGYCEVCGEWRDAELIDDGICHDCRRQTKISFDRLLLNFFTPLQLKALRQIEEEGEGMI